MPSGGATGAGNRFIDHVTVVGGKLIDQQVWNDLAESWPART